MYMHASVSDMCLLITCVLQTDRSHQVAKLVRRSSSKKKSGDPYTSAVTIARKLYMLDGFKKSEVAAKLYDQ